MKGVGMFFVVSFRIINCDFYSQDIVQLTLPSFKVVL